MSQVINPTTPLFSNTLSGTSGQSIVGQKYYENRIQGNSENNWILTGIYKDIVSGLGGDDTISTSDGDDSIVGGAGNDIISGQAGKDTVFGGIGSDSIRGGDGDDNLAGGAENDTIVGNDGDDRINGDDGDDSLFGNQGNDYLAGGVGNDTIYGGAGRDTIAGGDGNDLLSGDRGNDLLVGGSGNDTFLFRLSQDGVDTITDFNPAQDKIGLVTKGTALETVIGPTLDATEFTVTNVGPDAVKFVAQGSQAKIIYDKASGLLYVNNGGGQVTRIVQLKNELTLTPANFEIF